MLNRLRNIFDEISVDPITGYIKIGTTFTKTHFGTYAPAAPAAAATNRIVTTTNMKVGTYTIANASPADNLCKNVTVTTTATGTADTQGTITVAGTDYNSEVISEVIVPVAGSTITGKRAFKTVTAVTGAGWVINPDTPANDTIVVGFGDVLGLPIRLDGVKGYIMFVVWNQAILSSSTITYSKEISLCTVTQYATGDGTKKIIIGYVRHTGV